MTTSRVRFLFVPVVLALYAIAIGASPGAASASGSTVRATSTAGSHAAPGKGSGVRAAIAGWHMRKAASNNCLVARIGPGERAVEQSGCAEFSDQGWSFDYPFAPDATFLQIRNLDRNLCIVTRGNGESRAVVSNCNAGFADQLWRWSWDDMFGGYRFQNANSSLCLVARGNSPAVQSTCGEFSDQVWQLY